MTIADGPPDGSTHGADLTCPLCDYNLRGLTEPRCPECGFAFTWAELLDAKRDRHPWLFEHAVRGRRRRAFLSTYFRNCVPRRFWREVTPANPVRRARLIKYWIVTTLLLSGVIIGPLLVQAGRLAIDVQQQRARFIPIPGRPGQLRNTWPSNYGLNYTTAAIRAAAPPVWSRTFALRVADAYLSRTGGAFVAVVVVTAAWPWLTVATLMVFQASMRRAKTNSDHVLRAAIYGCDFGLLVTVLAIAAFSTMDDRGNTIPTKQVVELAAMLAVLTAMACVAITTYRLTIAYGRYLRFHLPLATVLASQVIAFLALLAVAVNVAQAW